MARATVSLADFVGGHLPPMCVRTGGLAEEIVELDAIALASSRVTSLAVLLGGLGGFLAVRARKVRGKVPMTSVAARNHRALRQAWVLAGIVLILATLVAVASVAVALVLGAAAVALGLLALVTGLRRGVSCVVDPDGNTVTISGVHDRFAAFVCGEPAGH